MSAIDLFQQLWPALYVIGALAFGWGMWQLSRYFVPRSEHTKLVDELTLSVRAGIEALRSGWRA